MQKTFLLIVVSFLVFSCGSQSQKEKSIEDSPQPSSTKIDKSKIGRNNYAVIWKWTTDNAQLVSDNSPIISKELTDLWIDDIVENAYYDIESPIDKFEYFPNIAFFLKAHSETKAKSILDELSIVQESIASYQIYPVGQLWLDRKTAIINEKGVTKSFVAVWTTKSDMQNENKDILIKNQSDTMLQLWNKGLVENVYFDIEGTNRDNNKTDFVFFVNANTKEVAESICSSLPFFKEEIATFQLYQAGVFWMGKYENQ